MEKVSKKRGRKSVEQQIKDVLEVTNIAPVLKSKMVGVNSLQQGMAILSEMTSGKVVVCEAAFRKMIKEITERKIGAISCFSKEHALYIIAHKPRGVPKGFKHAPKSVSESATA